MKNMHNVFAAAEKQVERYIAGMNYALMHSPHGKWVRRNRTKMKAVRAAGYLTGMGYLK